MNSSSRDHAPEPMAETSETQKLIEKWLRAGVPRKEILKALREACPIAARIILHGDGDAKANRPPPLTASESSPDAQ
jgi:hypothetical protein